MPRSITQVRPALPYWASIRCRKSRSVEGQIRSPALRFDQHVHFECDPPDAGKRRHGYSRDKRSDCVQVVIALIVTPEGFPLAYEVLAGNTSDKTTLADFLKKIET